MKFFGKTFLGALFGLIVGRLLIRTFLGNVLQDGNFLILVIAPMMILILASYGVRWFKTRKLD